MEFSSGGGAVGIGESESGKFSWQACETPLLGPAVPRTPASFLSARDDRPGTWPYNVFAHLGLSSVVVVLMLGLCDITERACSLVVSVVAGEAVMPVKNPSSW